MRQVEALYIHNFEEGMRDAQMAHLTRVLKKGHIWALNIGENFKLSAQAWNAFANELPCVATTRPLLSPARRLLMMENALLDQEYARDAHVRQRAAFRRHYRQAEAADASEHSREQVTRALC